ncbi:helix-turn-helix domain-containing protein [Azospirillum halopraeferens]|uniref:helix-turn-helix domain-containing protein n=1 Tax=Azospirillum halopraeferens TaxID=34010 RepID=UPI00040CE3C3|nr:helix-turn-helix domain-containing protein [Azospirillum halopraeferens]
MARTTGDLSPAEIRFRLNQKGLTYADVDRACGLKDGTARRAARQPHPDGELAIAEMLSCSPRELWPSRFNADGERLKPQPPENYTDPPRLSHRQKQRAA